MHLAVLLVFIIFPRSGTLGSCHTNAGWTTDPFIKARVADADSLVLDVSGSNLSSSLVVG